MNRILLSMVALMACLTVKGQKGNVDTHIAINTQENTNTFVVIISNEHYKFEEAVPYAINDGETFKLYCEKTLGIPEKNIKFAKDATLNEMRIHISWLERNVSVRNSNTHAIFYYSGHGMPDEDSKKAYLLPIDGSSLDPATGFSTEELYQRLGDMASTQTVVFLDACFSGAKREGGMMKSSRGVPIKAKNDPVQGNLVVFSAAQGSETAYPLKEKEHGLFTYYILEKLQETGGAATLGELADYVTEKVGVASIRENDKSQTPTIVASSNNQDYRNWQMVGNQATQYSNILRATDSQAATSQPTVAAQPKTAASAAKTLDMSAGGAFSLAGVTYEMVRVSQGSFLMGSKTQANAFSTFSLDKPVHRVTLKSYAIGKTEVTQALWTAVMGDNPSAHKGDDLPVENVSWDDCQEFLKRLNVLCGTNFRLPTEAEWEYAADGRNDGTSETYSGTTSLSNMAHTGSTTAACGSKRPNALGLVDMSGNVAEWCQDYFGKYPSGNQTNPQGPDMGYQRVVRGGSYTDIPAMMRNSHRGHQRPSVASPTVGLRLAHDI